MGTNFSEIFDRFVRRIKDHEILKFSLEDRENILEGLLAASQSKFIQDCGFRIEDLFLKIGVDLYNIDEENKCYIDTLSDVIIDILVSGMLYIWCDNCVADTDNFINVLNVNGLTQYSPANLLDKLCVLRDSYKKSFETQVVQYSYRIANVNEWKVRRHIR